MSTLGNDTFAGFDRRMKVRVKDMRAIARLIEEYEVVLKLIARNERVISVQTRHGIETRVESHPADELETLARVALKATTPAISKKPKFSRGDRVTKIGGSSWTGKVRGEYSTELTPEGYAVESENEPGSVQIYPAAALERLAEV